MPEGKLAENNACEVETTGPGAKLHKKITTRQFYLFHYCA